MTYFAWAVILALFVACYTSGRSTGRTEVRRKVAGVLRRMEDEGILDHDQAGMLAWTLALRRMTGAGTTCCRQTT